MLEHLLIIERYQCDNGYMSIGNTATRVHDNSRGADEKKKKKTGTKNHVKQKSRLHSPAILIN